LPVQDITITNVYRPPNLMRGHHIHRCITNIRVRGRTLVGGDFNAIDEMWQSDGSSRTGDHSVAEWAMEQGLRLGIEPDIGTHAEGNTIDLTFTNIPGAHTQHAPQMDTGSDHKTLVTYIPSRRTQGGYKYAKLED